MSLNPGSHRHKLPFKRSNRGKNEATLKKMLGSKIYTDKDWAAEFGVPRKRRFGGDWYRVSSLHASKTRAEAVERAKILMAGHGPYKYRVVQIQPVGYMVYLRLAHIKKAPGGGRTARRY